jgi:hypothetical protein
MWCKIDFFCIFQHVNQSYNKTMSLRRSQKSVQDLTLLGHEETKQNSNENNKPNSILSGKVSSTSKFAKKKGMCDATKVKNVSSHQPSR